MAVQKVFFESSKVVKWLNPNLAFDAQLGSQMGFYPIDEETGERLPFKTNEQINEPQKKSVTVADGEIKDYTDELLEKNNTVQVAYIDDNINDGASEFISDEPQKKKRGRKPKSTN